MPEKVSSSKEKTHKKKTPNKEKGESFKTGEANEWPGSKEITMGGEYFSEGILPLRWRVSSMLHIKTLANKGLSREPMATPSVCL